jgi:hypothetical protein
MSYPNALRRDSDLLAWSGTFAAKIAAAPLDFGLSEQQATEYATTQTRFADALRVVQDRDARTRTDTVIKNGARRHLVNASRMLVAVCEAWPQMTDAKRSALNIPIRDRVPTPRPRPSTAPLLNGVSQLGLTLKVSLRDAADQTRQGRPAGVLGATILTHVGEEAPASIDGWNLLDRRLTGMVKGYHLGRQALMAFGMRSIGVALSWRWPAGWRRSSGKKRRCTSVARQSSAAGRRRVGPGPRRSRRWRRVSADVRRCVGGWRPGEGKRESVISDESRRVQPFGNWGHRWLWVSRTMQRKIRGVADRREAAGG